MIDISERYAKYGQAVVDELSINMNRHGSLTPLLRRLGVQRPEVLEEEQQHQALQEILRRYGSLFFLSVSKSDWSPSQIEKMRRNLDVNVHTPFPGTLSAVQKTNPPKPENSPPSQPPSSPSSDPSDTATRSGKAQYRSPYSLPARRDGTDSQPRRDGTDAPRQGPPGSEKSPAQPSGQRNMIKTEGYEGPDRRILPDRRVATQDRRVNVELIYKNRRFGGRDRRKIIRRASDRQKSS